MAPLTIRGTTRPEPVADGFRTRAGSVARRPDEHTVFRMQAQFLATSCIGEVDAVSAQRRRDKRRRPPRRPS
jgi:hypothetical protein